MLHLLPSAHSRACVSLLQEIALLKAIEEAARSMLARCFQKYYAVSDSTPTGILDGDMANPESPAPVLKHAVKLAGADSRHMIEKNKCADQMHDLCKPHVGDGSSWKPLITMHVTEP